MDAFAINAKILIAQIINFSIILIVLWKFAYKPILAMFDERKNKIAKGLQDAEMAENALAESELKAKKIEDEAYQKADKIVQEAKAEAKKTADVMIKKAEDQAKKIVDNANAEAKTAKDKELRAARGQLGTLVMLAVEKVLGEKVDDAEKDKLTAKAIKEL